MRGNIAVLFLLFVASALFAQNSLFDNPNYRRSLDLQRQAKAAYDSGDYLKSAGQAKEAEELSKIARAEAETQLQRWTANSWKNRAATRIAFGERVNARERYPELWPDAQAAFVQAGIDFEAERYGPSIEASRKVVELLAGIAAAPPPPPPKPAEPAAAEPAAVEPAAVEPAPVEVVAAEPAPVEAVAAEPAELQAPEPVSESAAPVEVLPAFYTVRLIENRRNCFWRIAEYPFVYGDPLKWRILYDANKDRIPDPANPDLILPGETFIIPSINGEARSGTWSE